MSVTYFTYSSILRTVMSDCSVKYVLAVLICLVATTKCEKTVLTDNLKEQSNNFEESDIDIGDIFGISNTNTKNTNETKPNNNTTTQFDPKTIETQRIVQPSQSQAQPTQTVNTNTTFSPPQALKDFKPSPQLDTYYEYNKSPVVPAHGEAKSIFPDYNFGISARIPQAPWLKVRHYFNPEHEEKVEENDAKIRFPTPTPSTFPKIHPYQYVPPLEPIPSIQPSGLRKPDFVEEITHKTVSPNSIIVQDHIASTIKPIRSEEFLEPSTVNHGLGNSPPFYAHGIGGEGFIKPSFSYTIPSYPTAVGKYEKGNLFKKPSYEKPVYTEVDHPRGEHPMEHGVTPWKKIIKFLTAIIPFGLLLSALTPTIIDVSPMENGTVNGYYNGGRARLEGNAAKSSLELLNSLSKEGCEERVLCELLLNAGSSQNAQQHIENLLDTFIGGSRDSVEQKAELSRIFKAVKSENCSSLPCDQIRENSRESKEQD